MFFSEFNKIVSDMKIRKPRLFGLESDHIVGQSEISRIEESLKIELPEKYKVFLMHYGGGYFGYTVVFSCDSQGSFYLLDKVSKEWIYSHHFLPVLDFETGDVGGYRIFGGRCSEVFEVYLHDKDTVIEDSDGDFFLALLKYGLKI